MWEMYEVCIGEIWKALLKSAPIKVHFELLLNSYRNVDWLGTTFKDS